MLVRLRRYDEIARVLRDKKAEGWRDVNLTRGLFDRTVGIVSYGAIAGYLVKLLQPFHCNIKVYSRRALPEELLKEYKMEQVSLEEIFKTCDVISLHTAWNKHTEKMINKELIQSMKDGALLVNTARGQIIDEEALIEELKTGRINAALDVFWKEPLDNDSPLFDLDNVFITPHKGGPTHDRYKSIASNIIDAVYDYLTEGKVPECEIKREKAMSMTLS
jgi:phosphoglycerate dehydrogenase-like enzyme